MIASRRAQLILIFTVVFVGGGGWCCTALASAAGGLRSDGTPGTLTRADATHLPRSRRHSASICPSHSLHPLSLSLPLLPSVDKKAPSSTTTRRMRWAPADRGRSQESHQVRSTPRLASTRRTRNAASRWPARERPQHTRRRRALRIHRGQMPCPTAHAPGASTPPPPTHTHMPPLFSGCR